MMLHTKNQGSRPCCFRLEDFVHILYKSMQNMSSPGRSHFEPQGQNLTKSGRGPLDDASY